MGLPSYSTSPVWVPLPFSAADCTGGLPKGWWSAGGVAADVTPVATSATGVLFTGSPASQYMSNGRFNAPMIMAHCPRDSGDYTVHFDVFTCAAASNFGFFINSGGADLDHHYAGIIGVGSAARFTYYMINKDYDITSDTTVGTTNGIAPAGLISVGLRIQWSSQNYKTWFIENGVETAMNGGAFAPWARVGAAGATPYSQGGGRTLAITAGAGPFRLSSIVVNA